jgi:hypothetical protein
VFEDTVLISAVVVGWGDTPQWGGLARPAHRFMAFDKATGELRWMNGTSISPYDTTYSTPTVMPIGGQQAIVFGSGDGQLWAIQPRTGKIIWNLPLARMGLNASPLVTPDGRVFMSHSEENTFGNTMGTVVCVDGKQSGDLTGKEIWREFEVMAGKSSPILAGDRLYVIDDFAKMHIFDANTGEKIGLQKLGSVSRSTPLFADGKIYYCSNSGQWYIMKPTDDGVEIMHKLRLNDVDVDGSPIVSHGRIYFPTSGALYCIGNSQVQPSADPLPEPPNESPKTDTKPAQLQVVPYDILLAPGEEHHFRVTLFNALGQSLGEVPAQNLTFAVQGPGEISPDGTYKAPADLEHHCALVTVKSGELAGTARVRIVPPLPWKWDFNEDEDVPLTWIGGRVRYRVQDVNGERIIVKQSLLPTPRAPDNKLGTRSMMFMGPVELSNYTIQGDIMLPEGVEVIGTLAESSGESTGPSSSPNEPQYIETTRPNGKISDVGLINGGYFMTIRGESDKLRIDSWPSHEFRTHKMIDVEIEPATWYTMKFQVVPEKDKALVRGKLWKRGEAEPYDWSIEMVDNAPNLHSSPGLYGHASDAQIYLDNLQVTPN